jgi:hypothetical protein
MNEFGLISLIIGIIFLIFAILVKPTKQAKH